MNRNHERLTAAVRIFQSRSDRAASPKSVRVLRKMGGAAWTLIAVGFRAQLLRLTSCRGETARTGSRLNFRQGNRFLLSHGFWPLVLVRVRASVPHEGSELAFELSL